MSTTLLFAVCAGLVFSPVLIELARGSVRLARLLGRPRRARRRTRQPAPPPRATRDLEASIRSTLYGQDPRWQHIDVEPRPAAQESTPAPRPVEVETARPRVVEDPAPALSSTDSDVRAA